jgi:hypothetical protein
VEFEYRKAFPTNCADLSMLALSEALSGQPPG